MDFATRAPAVKLIIDASVTLKWLLAASPDESDSDKAQMLLHAIERGGYRLLQPPHWTTEVLAVLARREPEQVRPSFRFLRRLPVESPNPLAAYLVAADLAHRLNQHLFDTLYHAMAIEHDATLVTADDRYFRAARGEGYIRRLADIAQT